MPNKVKFKKHRKIWSQLSLVWEKFTEPGRPSRDDIRNYNKLLVKELKNKKNPEILVLGSTPEIRNLLFKYSLLQSANITCADMTREMYDAMSELVDNKNKKEKFVSGNWVDMKFNRKFDVVIGDYVNPNISTEYKDRYYKNILSLLKNSGCFITKDAVITKACRINSIDELFNEYIKKIKNEEITIKQSATWIALRLLWSSWFKNIKKANNVSHNFLELGIMNLRKKINSGYYKGNNLLIKAMHDKFIDAWRPFKNKYWTFYLKKDNNEMLKSYFEIDETLYSGDYDKILTSASPIYLLKKK